MVSAGYSGFEVRPDSGLFVCSKLCCLEPQPHARSRSLGRLLGRAAAGVRYERVKRMGSSTNEARCLAWISVKIKADDNRWQRWPHVAAATLKIKDRLATSLLLRQPCHCHDSCIRRLRVIAARLGNSAQRPGGAVDAFSQRNVAERDDADQALA